MPDPMFMHIKPEYYRELVKRIDEWMVRAYYLAEVLESQGVDASWVLHTDKYLLGERMATFNVSVEPPFKPEVVHIVDPLLPWTPGEGWEKKTD